MYSTLFLHAVVLCRAGGVFFLAKSMKQNSNVAAKNTKTISRKRCLEPRWSLLIILSDSERFLSCTALAAQLFLMAALDQTIQLVFGDLVYQ